MKDSIKAFQRTLAVVAGIFIIAAAGQAQAWLPEESDLKFSSGLCVNAVQDDQDDETRGDQYTVPLSLVYTQGQTLSAGLYTGYSDAWVGYPEDREAHLSGLTDTLMTVNYTRATAPGKLSLGINVNLPTGKEQLKPEEEDATLSDFFAVDTFGEGLNIGLNAGFLKEFTIGSLGINGQYVYKGKYDPSTELEDGTLDPGDQFLLSGAATWKASRQLMLMTLASYTYSLPDKVNGAKDFQEGPILLLGGAAQYAFGSVQMTLNMSATFPGRDHRTIDDEFRREPENSSGRTFTAGVSVAAPLSLSLNASLAAGVIYEEAGERRDAATGRPYAGESTRSSIAPGLSYQFNRRWAGFLFGEYAHLIEQSDSELSNSKVSQGLSFNTGMTYTF